MPAPDNVRIREARRGDRDSIYKLFAEAGIEVPVRDQSSILSWIVSHPETEVLLAADVADRGIGMIAMSHRPSLRVGGRLGTIDAFFVAKGFRRRGIGSALLKRSMERARNLGCRLIEAGVDDPVALEFLSTRGFEPTDKRIAVLKG